MRTALLLYAFALLVRLVLISFYPDPAFVDAYYYVNVAHQLAAGHGFNIDFIWTFVDVGGALPAHASLPIPSNAHWMPLASIVQVPFILAMGTTPWASALPFALIGALATPMTWAIAGEAGARSDVRLGAAILVALPAAMVFMAQPDNFSLFQVFVLGALWLGARGLRGDSRSFAASGLLVGLAMLARNDGILVGLALALIFIAVRWRAWRTGQPAAIAGWAAVVAVGLFSLVMVPWWARQLAVFGSISPSAASGRILWIRALSEMNSIVGRPTIQTFLGQGIGPLLASRIMGLVQAMIVYTVLVAGIVLLPVIVIGGWLRRHSTDFVPFFVYAALFVAFSTFISAVHVPNGTFIHSGTALAPYSSILALEGIVAVIGWVAARRSGWDGEQASRVFVTGAIVGAVLVGIWFSFTTQAIWAKERDVTLGVRAALVAAGAAPDEVVMSLDTSGVKYWTGHPGVVAPDDPIGIIESVARAYDARWLIVRRQDLVNALIPILDGTGRPSWVGAPTWTESAPGKTMPEAVLVPICFSPDDGRCAGPSGGTPGDPPG
jgi:hypothetical protein